MIWHMYIYLGIQVVCSVNSGDAAFKGEERPLKIASFLCYHSCYSNEHQLKCI